MSTPIRNIAIIAHVDHGKTTMVDQLLRQSGTFADHEKVVDTVMDNNAIERERGITILAKNCAVSWEGTHINIEEIRKPELDAMLVAQSVAQQLERRVMFQIGRASCRERV